MSGPAAATAFENSISTSSFLVEVDGVDIGRYAEVTGLQVEVEMHEYREGGVNGHIHRLPGRMTWPNLVMKRGVTNDDNLLAWFHRATGKDFASTGKVPRSTAAVTLIAPNGDRLRSWELVDAVPVRWSGPRFAVAADDVPLEELEVAHHGFTVRSY